MDAELKAKWVAALRSGKYRQGHNALMTDNGYCCLGLLCHLIDARALERMSHAELETSLIPRRFDIHNNAVLLSDYQYTLAQMNDGTGSYRMHNFTEIADYIEANL